MTGTREKVLKQISLQVRDEPVKREEYKAGMRKFKNITILQNNGGLISGLQCNAFASLVHFVMSK